MNTRSKKIYLDNNATTPTDERVVQAMLPYFTTQYANPGSEHLFGLTIEEHIEQATEQIAKLIHARPHEIIFTSGATESINLAIKGLPSQSRKHIITATTEHSSVLATLQYMEKTGYEVTRLPVEEDGRLDPMKVSRAMRENTLLVCVMLTNNETGVIQPIADIASVARSHQTLFLCDATQAVGKIPVDVNALGIDLMPFSAHKFYGPKGVGGLYIRSGIKLETQVHGGNQQSGLRSGTINVPGIVGMAKACQIAAIEMESETARIGQLRDQLESALLSISQTKLNGSRDHRLHTTSNITFRGVLAERLIFSLKNISVSSGSACRTVTTQPSHVLTAMGLSHADALSSLRFSLGRFTTDSDISETIESVIEAVSSLRR
jgi:cysteine desulfurase